MSTPSDYTHFENAVPCGADGLAVGAKGSEVTVADSSGNLYQAGTQLTLSAANLNKGIVHATTAGYKIAMGQATVDTSKAVTTGLTTITRAVATIVCTATPTGANGVLTMVKASYSGGTLTLKGFRPGAPATSDMEAVASNTCGTVDWIAIGV